MRIGVKVIILYYVIKDSVQTCVLLCSCDNIHFRELFMLGRYVNILIQVSCQITQIDSHCKVKYIWFIEFTDCCILMWLSVPKIY